VAGGRDGCGEGGDGGDSAVGDEGNARLGAKARRGAGVEGDIEMTAREEEVGVGDGGRIRSGDGAME